VNSRLQRVMVMVGSLVGAVIAGELINIAFGDGVVQWSVFAEAAVRGLVDALFAVGLVLVYRANRVINFAQAAFGVAAASLFFSLVGYWRWPWIFAAPAAVAAATLAGAIVQIAVVRRFSRAPRLVLTVVTIAIGQLLAGLAALLPGFFGSGPRPTAIARSPLSSLRWNLFPVTFRGDHLLAVGVAVVVLAAMALFFRFSSVGIAIRGAAVNDDRASLLGVDTAMLSTIVWAAGAGFAGLAAILALPLNSATLATATAGGIGAVSLMRALGAAVVGRMEDLPVTATAAVAIAMFERSVFWAFTDTAISDVGLLVLIVVVFLVQRSRLARTDVVTTTAWTAAEEVRPIPAELVNHPSVRSGVQWFRLVAVVAVLGFPWVMSPSQTTLGALYAIYAVIGISLVVLSGWGGQISLGQFAFVALGALVAGSLNDKLDVPFLFAVFAAGAVGAGGAVILGLPALRIKGLFLAVTTLSFAVCTATFFLNPRYFGSVLPGSLNRPALFGIKTEDPRAFYYLTLVAVGAAVFVAIGLRNGRTGRVLIAMRDNERAAQSFGVNLVRARLSTFAISGLLASFAGALFAFHQHAVSQASFAPEQSIQMFMMAVIGGLGSVQGVVIGAIYLGTVNLFVPAGGQLLASGVGVLLVLCFYPTGLGGAAYALRDAWLRRIALRDRIVVPSLIGNYRDGDGEFTRVPLAPNVDDNGREVDVPVEYRNAESRILAAGISQKTGGIEF
jgi:branched-chain amino acid transport system permease protein